MPGRRSHPRLAPADPWEGTLRVLREVVITGRIPGGVSALSPEPGVVGERMSLDLSGAGLVTTVGVKVESSRPVVVDGELRHELALRFVDGREELVAMAQGRDDGVNLILEADDRYGVLGRELPVRLLNFSASGSLLEGASALGPHAVGRLKVEVDGERYGDDVWVARCQEVPGAGSLYDIGVEFVWTSQPGRTSLRRFLRTRFLLPASGGRSPIGKEDWANGHPNGTRGAPSQRHAERGDSSAGRRGGAGGETATIQEVPRTIRKP